MWYQTVIFYEGTGNCSVNPSRYEVTLCCVKNTNVCDTRQWFFLKVLVTVLLNCQYVRFHHALLTRRTFTIQHSDFFKVLVTILLTRQYMGLYHVVLTRTFAIFYKSTRDCSVNSLIYEVTSCLVTTWTSDCSLNPSIYEVILCCVNNTNVYIIRQWFFFKGLVTVLSTRQYMRFHHALLTIRQYMRFHYAVLKTRTFTKQDIDSFGRY